MNDAWTFCVGQRQQPGKVKVVGKDDVAFSSCSLQDVPIRSSGVAYLAPVNSFEALFLERSYPKRRKVHIDEKFQA